MGYDWCSALNRIFLGNTTLLLACILLLGMAPAVDSRAAHDEQQSSVTKQDFLLEEKPQTLPFKLVFTGNTHFSENDLLRAAAAELKMFEQKGFRKADIDDAAYQMRLTYLQSGFAFAFVDYKYERTGKFVRITFVIEEGPRVFVREMNFRGNSFVQSATLRDFFPQPSRMLRRQPQEMVFVEAEVRDAVNRIRNYYRGEGFIDVNVKNPELDFTEDRTGVNTTLEIDEGARYFIQEIVLNGHIIDELSSKLEKIKNEFKGKTYYVRRNLLLRTSLEEAYDSIGYADAEFKVVMERLEEPGKVRLEAFITSNEIITIDQVIIGGNAITKESFIRSRVQFNPGDIYTKAKRQESFRKLFDSGLFSKITIELMPSDQKEKRNLKVVVEELHTREYYFEPGWGSYEELRLRAGVFGRNLFGKGRNGRLDGLVSTKGETFTVSYTDPWFLETDIRMNLPLSYERREEPSYTSEEVVISTLFSKKLSRNLTLSTGYGFKMTQLFSLADDSQLSKGEDDYNKGTISMQATWDNRDDIFYPASGLQVFSGFAISLPALGSDLDFGRITLGCRYFFELSDEYIIGLRATSGLILPIRDQDYIPISERFFNGGSGTVRSYKHSELGTKDENNDPLGGLGYNVFSVELRKRFYENFAATLYVDAGNISPNRSLLENDFSLYTSSSDLLDDTLNDYFSEFKYGIGIGLQYLLPVGPIRFDIAYNPDPEEIWDEDSWVFHFSLGMAF